MQIVICKSNGAFARVSARFIAAEMIDGKLDDRSSMDNVLSCLPKAVQALMHIAHHAHDHRYSHRSGAQARLCATLHAMR